MQRKDMSRTALSILSTENLLHNITVIRAQTPRSKIVAMVKANAYGHGLRSTSLRLQHAIDMLGVSCIDEALALRKAGVKIPILLAEGVFEPRELIIASAEKFAVAFHTPIQIEWLKTTLLPRPIEAWLKVDTGLGRLGFDTTYAHHAYAELIENKSIKKPITIMSHFACADTPEHPLNTMQKERFDALASQMQGTYSICNSAAVFTMPEMQYDYVRPGIAVYGISPFIDRNGAALGLKPVMTIRSTLIASSIMAKGSSLGYGARYTCPEKMPVGVVAFGYGDGYPVTAQDGTPVLVNNKRCTVIGRISMDMLTVDLRNCPDATIGSQVVLWGEGLPLEEVVPYMNTIAWEMLTSIQNRVQFLWTQL
jgi:alanine racemase